MAAVAPTRTAADFLVRSERDPAEPARVVAFPHALAPDEHVAQDGSEP